jgi:hypothetical protein
MLTASVIQKSILRKEGVLPKSPAGPKRRGRTAVAVEIDTIENSIEQALDRCSQDARLLLDQLLQAGAPGPLVENLQGRNDAWRANVLTRVLAARRLRGA